MADWTASWLRRGVAAPQQDDRVLRESEALLALLRATTLTAPAEEGAGSSSGSARQQLPPDPAAKAGRVKVARSQPVTTTSRTERLLAAQGTKLLPQELAAFVSNAQLPLGAQLCEVASDFRRAHSASTASSSNCTGGTIACSSSSSSACEAAADAGEASTGGGAAAIAAVALGRVLSWRPGLPFATVSSAHDGSGSTALGTPTAGSTPSAAASAATLAAAIGSARRGLAALHATLDVQLPEELRADERAQAEARTQLDSALHRALFPTLWPLYLRAHDDPIGRLAPRCHALRTLLPCDLVQLPTELWLLPLNSGGSSGGSSGGGSSGGGSSGGGSSGGGSSSLSLGSLRAGGVGGTSDPRLPYASAIQLLHTISFYRTPAEKAKVLLEACEEVVKCATRAMQLHAAAAAAATAAASTGGGGGGGEAGNVGKPPPPSRGGGASSLSADNLLPLFIYVVVRSGVYSLPAELAYVADFLGEGLVHGQVGYALVSLQCACTYAQELEWGVGLLHPMPDPDGTSSGSPSGGDALLTIG
jgi:hypothetical protein